MLENKNIFQIYIQDDDRSAIPQSIQSCIISVKNNSPGYEHFLFGNEALHEVIKNNFELSVLQAYERLIPYTYKSDLARHCLLYLFGGWYFDSSVRLSQNLPTNITSDLIVFKDAPNPGMPSWDLSTAVIYGRQKSKIFQLMIERIVDNVRSGYYGMSPLSPTGPTLFGRCLSELGESSTTITGMLLPLTPFHYYKNNAFILPKGEILAYGKFSWGTPDGDGLRAFNAAGTNSYNELYYARNIYKLDQ